MRAGEVRTWREPGSPSADGDAAAENVELGFGGLAGDLDQVGLFHAGGGLGEAVGQLAVVGDHEQALAHVVQAADGVEALLHLVEELHHRGAALGVLDGGDEAAGLVEDEVAVALGALEQLAVHADVVAGGVGLGAQHGDDLAVDLRRGPARSSSRRCGGWRPRQRRESFAGARVWRGDGAGSELRLGFGFDFSF